VGDRRAFNNNYNNNKWEAAEHPAEHSTTITTITSGSPQQQQLTITSGRLQSIQQLQQ